MEKSLKNIFDLDLRREAQFYALMEWKGKTKEEATEIIVNNDFDVVDSKYEVYSKSSVTTAEMKVKEYAELLKGKNPYKAIVEIVASIHNKWVTDNAKKYDRGNVQKSEKQIFQHLPTALIGLDEVAKDLMFLAPFLAKQGINVGEMSKVPYGGFKPSEKFKSAYDEYVEEYKTKHKLETKDDLASHIEKITENYEPLKGKDETSKKRKAYMKNPKIVAILVDEVAEKNSQFEYGVTV